MGASAKVFPVLARGAGGVEGEFGVVATCGDCALTVVDLVLAALSLELGHALGDAHLVATERAVFRDDLLHLGFDRREVAVAEGAVVGELDVVVELVLEGRAVHELGFGHDPLDRLGHNVRGGVADEVQRVLADLPIALLVGHDLELAITVEHARDIAELAINLAAQRRGGELGADGRCDIASAHGSGEGFLRTVGKGDGGHVGLNKAKSEKQ